MDKSSIEKLFLETKTLTDDFLGGNYLELFCECPKKITFCVKLYTNVSDRLLHNKIDKFIIMANNFQSSGSFDGFKQKMHSDSKYKSKVCEYMLLKINKFDSDYKLKIFSNACMDFFYSNITKEKLIEISETIDLISFNDIKLIEKLHDINNYIKINDILIENLTTESIYSYISKLKSLNLVSEEPTNTHENLSNVYTKKVELSEFGNVFVKYV